MNNEKSKKIKSQKNTALLLIIVPSILFSTYLSKTDLDKYGMNNYIICGALVVLMIFGGIGLNNSLRKQRDLNNE